MEHRKHSTSLAARTAAAERLHAPVADITTEVVSGGYSNNRRELVGYDGAWVFVKEVDADLLPTDGEEELWWLKKEHLCIEALRGVVPEYVAAWGELAVDDHVLLTEAFRAADGWCWSPPRDQVEQHEYIQAAIQMMKQLEAVGFDDATRRELLLEPYFRDKLAFDEGFATIQDSADLRSTLYEKYAALHTPRAETMASLIADDVKFRELSVHARELALQPEDAFNHCDARGDNIAYNLKTHDVKFVDWNWASYAPSKSGTTEFLMDMARHGVDVRPWKNELNRPMLAATVGLYLERCVHEDNHLGPEVRVMQMEAAMAAYELYNL